MKKKYSIRSKFLITVVSAMMVIAIFVGAISILEIDHYVQNSTESLIYAICDKEVAQINSMFGDMEKSVRMIESYTQDLILGVSDVTDPTTRASITAQSEQMFSEIAENTEGAVAYYLRFDPSLSDGVAGFFYSKIAGQDGFLRFAPTDIHSYDREDTEHVGWFWEPYEAGRPMWMQPYFNQNNNIYTISYVIPMYCEGRFIGVAGMDFDYSVLTEKIDAISVYENGRAHLESNGRITYYKELDGGVSLEELKTEYMQVSKGLNNGMTLVISASYRDIGAIRYSIIFKIVLGVFFFTLLFLAIMIAIVYRLVQPLKQLTDAAEKMSRGQYDINRIESSTKEIDLLSSAFQNMAIRLGEHDRFQHQLAYRDSMTGLRNTTSFQVWCAEFEKRLPGERFGVLVLDINNLKEANDRYGHDMGNRMIKSAARLIAGVYKHSPVFRIGGDEFVVILQDRDLEAREALAAELEHCCEQERILAEDSELPLRIAKGVSLYLPSKDQGFNEVFQRADAEMYKNKRKMKEEV